MVNLNDVIAMFNWMAIE